MYAAVVTRFGGPEVLQLQELPDPTPGPGQVAIDVSHAAVGLIDAYIRQGRFENQPGMPTPPFVPGLEVAGTVRALGEGVSGLRVGEPVVTLTGAGGGQDGYASIAVVDAALAVSLDGLGVDPAAAVAALPNAASAWASLTQLAHIKEGDRLLVHGALGGLASAFPGVAKSLGAGRVVGTARRSSLEGARASALPYDEVVAGEELIEAVGETRFEIVVDPVGGQVRTDSLQVMAPFGRMLLVGNAAGDWEHSVRTNDLWLRNLALYGFSGGVYFPTHPEQVRPAAQGAIAAITQGLVDIRTESIPAAEAAEAHRRVEKGGIGGRIVLTF
ncbi:quinone oxidoreductase family protein [Micromonospora mirobrigensis]|uniref:NADPH2:quinone reductase n=1 Tax=Micromonospora mirobrigensis TaxID=262898 RepID=A0A1C5AHQ0_9ACTN|nr:zinc-binding dehydrogenase [Micromonospora mirobrigensis]SCF44733.1 NADPH2:quinone reductase [Micromonospora mirobrigensis]